MKAKTVTMLEFRKGAASYLKRLSKGEHFVLSHRGRPAALLTPIESCEDTLPPEDPAWDLTGFAVDGPGGKFTSRAADRLLYGKK